MGSSNSYLKSNLNATETVSMTKSDEKFFEAGYTSDGSEFFDFALLDDLLIDILSYVPAEELIKTCRLVCKEFKEIVDGHSVWKLKCQREKKIIPRLRLDKLPDQYYEFIYFHNPYGRNLLENPYGEDGTNKWTLTHNGGDGWVFENPPEGAEPVPEELCSQFCFATACLLCEKHQIVDLWALGIPREVLALKTTKIQIGEWYAARFDCSSLYELKVTLLDENYNLRNEEENLDEFTVDNFKFSYREEQWIGREWHQVTHSFENVGNARYVFFQHAGKDSQFWAGNYGSKMTGAFVKVLVE